MCTCPACEMVIMPAQMQLQLQVLLSDGILAISTSLVPGVQGAGVTGMQGIGVKTPSAAAVAAITAGLEGELHIPNGRIFNNGMWSMMVAAGMLLVKTRLVGNTTSELGAAPKEQASKAPMHTCCGISNSFMVFTVFSFDPGDDIRQVDLPVVLPRGLYRTVAQHIQHLSAGQLIAGNLLHRRFGRIDFKIVEQQLVPELFAFMARRFREIDRTLETPRKSFVHVGLEIRGEHDQSGKIFNALQQVSDFLVGVAVVRAFGLGTLAKQSIGFVKKEDPVTERGFIEEPAEVFFA